MIYDLSSNIHLGCYNAEYRRDDHKREDRL